MRSGHPRNASEQRWLEAVAGMRSIIPGLAGVIRHCVGETAKHNTVSIGHWWIIALTPEEHAALHAGDLGSRKELEKLYFRETLDRARAANLDLPPTEVIEAIASYHR